MWKLFERSLLTFGILAIGYCGFIALNAERSQINGRHQLERSRFTSALSSEALRMNAPRTGDVVGQLEIPRLGLSTVVFEGADDGVLDRGAGHLTGSALPGDRGNMVLAAHRDTFFRPLRNVRVGDQVKIRGRNKDSVYVVESTTVVEPDDTYVLNATAQPALTLITCYPFRYIGPAPERFIVRAVLAQP
jgi:sortase A